MYWLGCVESRTPAARARAPTAASSAAHSSTWPWNCGRSGCVAYGASDAVNRYMRIAWRSQ
jgi:hypothetical protein